MKQLSYPRFCDAYLWIRDKRGRLIPFMRNSIQKKYRTLKRRAKKFGKKRFLVLKYRRGGITTEEQADSFYRSLQPGQKTVTMAHTREDAQVIFQITQLYYEKLSESIKPEKTRSIQKELVYPALGSWFRIATARASASARGSTLQKFHGSEVAFWPGRQEQIDELLASITQATSHGDVVFESTANGHNHFYKLWKDAKTNPESEWVPIFLPWFRDDRNYLPIITDWERDAIIQTLTTEEAELVKRFGLTCEQIKWRRRKQAELPRLFYQEYPEDDESAFLHTGVSYFDKFIVAAKIKNACRKPQKVELGGRVQIWRLPEPGKKYVAGSDTAEGLQGDEHDKSVTCILERDTGNLCAKLTCQDKPHEFAHNSVALCTRYNHAFWGIEAAQHGHAVLSTVIHDSEYPKAQIYKHKYYDSRTKKKYRKPGWPTTQKTRPQMLNHLAETMEGPEDDQPDWCDSEFWAECKTFNAQASGKYAASGEDHDDHIFALGIAMQMRKHRPQYGSVTVAA